MATLMGNMAMISGFSIASYDMSSLAHVWEMDYQRVRHDVTRFLDTSRRVSTSITTTQWRVFVYADDGTTNPLPLGIGTTITLKLGQKNSAGTILFYYQGTGVVTDMTTRAVAINGAPAQVVVYSGEFTATAANTLAVTANAS